MEIVKMFYRDYKKHYSDCETVPGSYNKANKSIEVIVPDGRMKKSGVRGETFKHLWFDGTDEKGKTIRVCIKAVSVDNAIKTEICRQSALCPESRWTILRLTNNTSPDLPGIRGERRAHR